MIKAIKNALKKYKEPILYILFGGLTTVVNFAVFYLMNMALGEALYLVNNIIAWLAAALFAYITNKLWVFDSKSFAARTVLKELAEFFSARLFSLGVEESGLWLLVDKMSFDRFSFSVLGFEITGVLISKLVLAVIVVILNYVFSKFVIFRKKKKK